MGFPTGVLAPDEQVHFLLRPHWRALVWPIVWLVTVAAMAGYIVGRLGLWLAGQPEAVFVSRAAVVLVAVTIAAFVAVAPIARWMGAALVLTDRRLLIRTGVISRSGRDVPLVKINEVSFSQTLTDRFFGCGTLVVQSASEWGVLAIKQVPQIHQVQREINILLDRYSPRAWYAAGSAGR